MRRKARVAGAAVGIPQDTEGDATGLKRGWVLHATERSVVLRDAQNSLRVADALAFCAGSIVVQHGVELPLNATFSSNNYPAKYAVAWINSPECDSEHSSAVYVVDFQTGEVSVEHLPNLNEQIGDVFVDSNGKQIAVDAAFAILLANGQISIAYPDVNSFELLAIATFSTLSKRLSLSALLGKAVSAALQLVWIGQIKHIVVDFGTGCAAFKLEIVDEEFSSKPFADPNGPTKLFPTFGFAQSKRRMVTSLDKDPSNFNYYCTIPGNV
ncbi:uncharacterized protein KRP23_851 [Phytophthora ramorum]|uniref:uncharacterized protein n=1 Tax=Phytophthora ramorum TaxID=164328 RepID=UPI0030AC12F0|nr:hypothetical protein KRP23_851 [Phytophthora ramorum]